MSRLELVPKREPSAAEAVRTRVKAMPRPDGMLQCPRCGSRSVMKIEQGVIIKNGKRKRGTLIERDICATCYRSGITSDMRTGNEKPERVK